MFQKLIPLYIIPNSCIFSRPSRIPATTNRILFSISFQNMSMHSLLPPQAQLFKKLYSLTSKNMKTLSGPSQAQRHLTMNFPQTYLVMRYQSATDFLCSSSVSLFLLIFLTMHYLYPPLSSTNIPWQYSPTWSQLIFPFTQNFPYPPAGTSSPFPLMQLNNKGYSSSIFFWLSNLTALEDRLTCNRSLACLATGWILILGRGGSSSWQQMFPIPLVLNKYYPDIQPDHGQTTSNKIMINKHLQKINSLLSRAKTQTQTQNFTDSLALISTHMGRTTTSNINPKRNKSYHTHKVTYRKQQISTQLEDVLYQMFKAKCKDIKIEVNKRSWQLFLKTFVIKNKIRQGVIATNCLNLGHFSLTHNCMAHINTLLQLSTFKTVNLSNNLLNPNQLRSLPHLKQLILNNCKLGNDVLQSLFEKLLDSSIEKISLSSPQVKDRNQLTRYDKLISLIKKSQTLETVLLSNVEIQPDNSIMERARNTNLKHLDLSDNTNVRGINPSLLSLNLSRNGLNSPFDTPLPPCQLQSLNISYNKVPYYLFKTFLKTTYFPALRHLNLDHIRLEGSIYPIQQFLQHSLSMVSISVVECDFSCQSYINMANGIKGSNNLKYADLSRNRVTHQKVALALSQMLQGGSLTHLKMRHCDIKDHLGALIFKDLNKTHAIESIDMMNNLLGDDTAKTLCKQLKKAKTVTQLKLDQNIIKYKDQDQIDSYLVGNRHYSVASLNQKYRQLNYINKQQEENDRRLRQEDEKVNHLQEQFSDLENTFLQKFMVCNQHKKEHLKDKIEQLRRQETKLQEDLFIRQTMMVPSSIPDLDLLSHRQSMFDNPESNINIQIASPRPGQQVQL